MDLPPNTRDFETSATSVQLVYPASDSDPALEAFHRVGSTLRSTLESLGAEARGLRLLPDIDAEDNVEDDLLMLPGARKSDVLVVLGHGCSCGNAILGLDGHPLLSPRTIRHLFAPRVVILLACSTALPMGRQLMDDGTLFVLGGLGRFALPTRGELLRRVGVDLLPGVIDVALRRVLVETPWPPGQVWSELQTLAQRFLTASAGPCEHEAVRLLQGLGGPTPDQGFQRLLDATPTRPPRSPARRRSTSLE